MLPGKRVHVLGLGRVWMGSARGWAQHSAGHTCAQGTLSSPSSQPDAVGGVSADHRCLTHSSSLHPKLRRKMSFPHVVPSADLLCVGSAPLLEPLLHFPLSELSKGRSALQIRVPVLVHSPAAPLQPWIPWAHRSCALPSLSSSVRAGTEPGLLISGPTEFPSLSENCCLTPGNEFTGVE